MTSGDPILDLDEISEENAAMGKDESSKETEVSKLRTVVEREKARSEGYLTRLKYLQADLENFRKRAEKELREAEDYSNSKLVSKLLPVLDELELAVAARQKEGDPLMTEGVAMVLKNMRGVLESEGLKPIKALGMPFDPRVHEAVEKVEVDRAGDDIVIEEVRRGYVFRDRLLRPSLVKVEVPLSREGKGDKPVKEEAE